MFHGDMARRRPLPRRVSGRHFSRDEFPGARGAGAVSREEAGASGRRGRGGSASKRCRGSWPRLAFPSGSGSMSSAYQGVSMLTGARGAGGGGGRRAGAAFDSMPSVSMSDWDSSTVKVWTGRAASARRGPDTFTMGRRRGRGASSATGGGEALGVPVVSTGRTLTCSAAPHPAHRMTWVPAINSGTSVPQRGQRARGIVADGGASTVMRSLSFEERRRGLHACRAWALPSRPSFRKRILRSTTSPSPGRGSGAPLSQCPRILTPAIVPRQYGLDPVLRAGRLPGFPVSLVPTPRRPVSYSQLLAQLPMFEPLSGEELDQLSGLLQQRRYAKGGVSFHEGDVGTALFIVRKGEVVIRLSSAEGREVILSILSRGESFGELALLDGEPRSTDAVAREETHLLSLHQEDFRRFLSERPQVAMRLLAVLSRMVRRITQHVHDAAFLEGRARLARVLLELARSQGQQGAEGILLPKRTQADLANQCGVTRESANKWLRHYVQEGLLSYENGQITLLDVERLRQDVD